MPFLGKSRYLPIFDLTYSNLSALLTSLIFAECFFIFITQYLIKVDNTNLYKFKFTQQLCTCASLGWFLAHWHGKVIWQIDKPAAYQLCEVVASDGVNQGCIIY